MIIVYKLLHKFILIFKIKGCSQFNIISLDFRNNKILSTIFPLDNLKV